MDFLSVDHCCIRGLRHGVTQQGPAALFTLKGKVGLSSLAPVHYHVLVPESGTPRSANEDMARAILS